MQLWYAVVDLETRPEVEAMSVSLQEFGIDRLGVEERLALVDAILASVATESGSFPLSPAQREELDRRIADDDRDPDDVIPWEDVKRSLLDETR
jgi:putative addiction module component (TIGR02574 family)